MFKEGGNFLLNNIEKIVLPLFGVVCLWLLITKVLISPNYVEYQGEKFGPGEIDEYVQKQAQQLEIALKIAPEQKKPPEKQLDKFLNLFNSSFAASDIRFPIPANISSERVIGKYGVPSIGQVKAAQAEHIRAVAYLPKVEVDAENPYSDSDTEPNDLDMVTVEGKLDVAQVYEKFYETYAGDGVNPEWRDPCLAVPVFAAVELQRQTRQPDGQWADWQQVPRAKIDARRKMLEIIEDVEDLPRGGMKVRLLQFSNSDVTADILQPEGYQIGSTEEDWFPPSLHKKFVKLLAEEKAAERREKMAEEKEKREERLEQARSSRSERNRPTTTRDGGGMGGGMGMPGGGGFDGGGTRDQTTRTRERSDRRRERPERERPKRESEQKETIDDVYKQLEELQINDKTDFTKTEDDLLFWAHDDTVQPGETYRYRIRVGMFNPLAGSTGFEKSSEHFKDKVILWSDFSETDSVGIPSRLYFFPIDMQQAANTLKVEVAKYAMGYWYSSDFFVKPGEEIGGINSQKPTEEEQQKSITVPEQIDYTTGAMLIDAMAVDDWTGSKTLRPRQYFNMFYSYDGIAMESVPIRQRYWASDMQGRYNEIRSSMKQPKEPLRSWGGQMKGRGPSSRPGSRPGDEMMPGMMPGMPMGPGMFMP